MKVAVIGGGSTYTPELVDGIARLTQTSLVSELVLVDPDESRRAVVGPVSARIMRAYGHPAAVSWTADLDEGLDGYRSLVAAAGRVEQLRHARRQVAVVVRIINDIPLARRVQQLAGAVVARRDDRQPARHRLQHDVRAGVVERRVDEEVRGEVTVEDVVAEADKAHPLRHAEAHRQSPERLGVVVAGDEQAERPRRHQSHCPK